MRGKGEELIYAVYEKEIIVIDGFFNSAKRRDRLVLHYHVTQKNL